MGRSFRFILIVIMIIVSISMVQAIEPSWEYRPPYKSKVDEVGISDDNTVVVGGDSLYFLSSEGKKIWGGYGSERIIVSNENRMVIMTQGSNIKAIDLNGILLWEDTMDCPIVDIAASKNGSKIVGIDEIGNSILWRSNGSRIKVSRSRVPQKGLDVVISHDGEQIIKTTNVNVYSLGKYEWNISRETHPWFFPITDIVVNPKGDSIVMAGGKWLNFWEGRESEIVSENRLIWNRDIISGDQLALAISDDGSTIVIGSDNNIIYVVDRNGSLRWTNTTGYWVRSVAVTSKGEYILAGSFDSHLYIFDQSGNFLSTFLAGRPIWAIALSPDESLLVIATDEAITGFKNWKEDLSRDAGELQNSGMVPINRAEGTDQGGPSKTQAPLTLVISMSAIVVVGAIYWFIRKRRE